MMVLGTIFMAGALARGTTLGPALGRGRGPRWPITTVGRVCLFLAGLLVAVEGYRGGIRQETPLAIPLRR